MVFNSCTIPQTVGTDSISARGYRETASGGQPPRGVGDAAPYGCKPGTAYRGKLTADDLTLPYG